MQIGRFNKLKNALLEHVKTGGNSWMGLTLSIRAGECDIDMLSHTITVGAERYGYIFFIEGIDEDGELPPLTIKQRELIDDLLTECFTAEW